ncbi:MAG: cell division protein SepF [Candidatus Woesearchaeota archaeon]|nr:cell division protein SepF [Candidatus Woesearchaeota archaeon]
MSGFFASIKNKVKSWGFDEEDEQEFEDEYVELDTSEKKAKQSKVIVRTFILQDFSDLKTLLDVMREGQTICLLNIRPLKEKDMIELKRAVNKLKKTVEAVGGDIAGVGDDYIVVTPAFAEIHKSKEVTTADSEE